MEVPVVEKTLLETVLDAGGLGAAGSPISIEGLPIQVKEIARALAPVVVYSKDIPMARLEWVSVEDESGSKD